jgi:ABC-type polysaccharide/polyol phosphate transport system ATPase subunit
VIELGDVTLTFPGRSVRGIRDWLGAAFGHHAAVATTGGVDALRGVSLRVERGERLGIIGANGAGKTTLLKTVSGIYPPTSGRVRVDGELACLFELATGFEMEANGWENIRTRGLLLGLSRAEIRARSAEIAAFSDLGAALDRPVKTYSAGMFVRLAFAVSTSISPDVLLLDEIIGAGDMQFQEKAKKRLDGLIAKASLLLLVSHEMRAIRRLCSRVVWLESGSVQADGSPDDVIAAYESSRKVA